MRRQKCAQPPGDRSAAKKRSIHGDKRCLLFQGIPKSHSHIEENSSAESGDSPAGPWGQPSPLHGLRKDTEATPLTVGDAEELGNTAFISCTYSPGSQRWFLGPGITASALTAAQKAPQCSTTNTGRPLGAGSVWTHRALRDSARTSISNNKKNQRSPLRPYIFLRAHKPKTHESGSSSGRAAPMKPEEGCPEHSPGNPRCVQTPKKNQHCIERL